MEFRSGKTSTASISRTSGTVTSTVELPTIGWSVNPKSEFVVFRNSKTGTYSKKESTFKDCDFTITIDHDADESVFEAPIDLDVGDRIGAKLFLSSGTSGAHWDFPDAIVTETPQTVEVDGKLGTVINATVDGTWSRPVES